MGILFFFTSIPTGYIINAQGDGEMSEINVNRLIEERKKKGYSQKFVAISVGVAASIVSRWESGKKIPSRESLAKLADLYGVTIDYLMGRGENIEAPAVDDSRLDEDLFRLIRRMDQKEQLRLKGFAEGLIASRAEEPFRPQ